jgi:hypothetical protein
MTSLENVAQLQWDKSSIEFEDLASLLDANVLESSKAIRLLSDNLHQHEWDLAVQFKDVLNSAYLTIFDKKDEDRTVQDMKILAFITALESFGHDILEKGNSSVLHCTFDEWGRFFINWEVPVFNPESLYLDWEVYQWRLAMFDTIFDAVTLLSHTLRSQYDNSSMLKWLTKQQKKEIHQYVEALEKEILNNKEWYSTAFISHIFSKEKRYETVLDDLISSAFSDEMLVLGNKVRGSDWNIYAKMFTLLKDRNNLVGDFNRKHTLAQFSVLARQATGERDTEAFAPAMEEYILSNDSLKAQIPWIASAFDWYSNVLKPAFEVDNNTEILEDFMIMDPTTFLDKQFSPDTLQGMELARSGMKDSLVVMLAHYKEKLPPLLEDSEKSIQQEIYKSSGWLLYYSWLQETDSPLLDPQNHNQLNNTLTQFADRYAQYDWNLLRFSFGRKGSPPDSLLSLWRQQKGLINPQIDGAFELSRRSSIYSCLKTAIVSAGSLLYANKVDSSMWNIGRQSNIIDRAKASKSHHQRLSKNPVLNAYIDMQGIGDALNFSDKTVAKIVDYSKELAIQVALIAISWWAANLATKAAMLAVSRGASLSRLSTSFGQTIANYYAWGRVAVGSKILVWWLDLAVEWSLFNVFHTVLSDQVSDTWLDWLTQASSYLHSIAFIWVMKAFGKVNNVLMKKWVESPVVQQWMHTGKLTQSQLNNTIKTLTIPMEVWTFAWTECVMNFAESVITGDDMRPVDLTNIVALVLGLRLAHAWGNPFKKGEQIIIKKFTIKDGKVSNLAWDVVSPKIDSPLWSKEKSLLDRYKNENLPWSKDLVVSTSQLDLSWRISFAKKLLWRELSPIESQAILDAHYIGWEIFDLSLGDIRQKTEILSKVGFTSPEIKKLLDYGVCGELWYALSSSQVNEFIAKINTQTLTIESAAKVRVDIDSHIASLIEQGKKIDANIWKISSDVAKDAFINKKNAIDNSISQLQWLLADVSKQETFLNKKLEEDRTRDVALKKEQEVVLRKELSKVIETPLKELAQQQETVKAISSKIKSLESQVQSLDQKKSQLEQDIVVLKENNLDPDMLTILENQMQALHTDRENVTKELWELKSTYDKHLAMAEGLKLAIESITDPNDIQWLIKLSEYSPSVADHLVSITVPTISLDINKNFLPTEAKKLLESWMHSDLIEKILTQRIELGIKENEGKRWNIADLRDASSKIKSTIAAQKAWIPLQSLYERVPKDLQQGNGVRDFVQSINATNSLVEKAVRPLKEALGSISYPVDVKMSYNYNIVKLSFKLPSQQLSTYEWWLQEKWQLDNYLYRDIKPTDYPVKKFYEPSSTYSDRVDAYRSQMEQKRKSLQSLIDGADQKIKELNKIEEAINKEMQYLSGLEKEQFLQGLWWLKEKNITLDLVNERFVGIEKYYEKIHKEVPDELFGQMKEYLAEYDKNSR